MGILNIDINKILKYFERQIATNFKNKLRIERNLHKLDLVLKNQFDLKFLEYLYKIDHLIEFLE
jgi:hypothetical protein